MQALLLEKTSRLEAQLEVQHQKTRIKELEQKVHALEEDKRLSARKPDNQPLQPAMATSSSDPALRDEIAQLHATIAERDETVSALLTVVRKYHERLNQMSGGLREAAAEIESKQDEVFRDIPGYVVAAIHNRNRQSATETAAEEHQPRKESKTKVSVTDTDNSKPSSTPPTIGFQAEILHQVPPATPSKFPADSASNPTAPSQPNCADGEEEELCAYKSKTKESSSDTEEDVEEADLDRSRRPTLSLESHPFVSHQPASTSFATETETALRASDSGEGLRWPSRMRCAFMTKSADRSTGPIGDPFQATNGWAVHLEVDAGLHGRPNISLHFSINKGRKHEPVSRRSDRLTEFVVAWRTGVVDDQRPMIEAFEAAVVSDYPRSEMPQLRMVVDERPNKRQQDLTNLLALKFKSNGIEKPEISATAKKPWRGLPTDVQQSFDILFFVDEPRWVTIWLCVGSTSELAMSSWISALQRAVNRS